MSTVDEDEKVRGGSFEVLSEQPTHGTAKVI
jgi:hypothetical protein